MILVIAAMSQERDAFLALCNDIEYKVIRGVDVAIATLEGHDIAIALSGIAMVNATFTASVLCEHFNPIALINIGSAGGLVPQQRVGDICIADVVRAHDLNIGDTTHTDERFVYESDPKLQAYALDAVKTLGLNSYIGMIVSGDQFVVHDSYELKRIHKYFSMAICVEMEGYALGMVASKFEIPFLILRSLSDVPLKDGNEVDFETYLPLAAKNSSLICKEVIKNIKKD